jgi:hypothetical protein
MRTLAVPFAALLLLGGAGCSTEGLAFTQDQRVEIVSPDYREILELPVEVDWDVTDDQLASDLRNGTTFGVYIDVDPQPPGEALEYFARDDVQCQKSPDCPNERYLRRKGIHTTTASEITFGSLPIAPGVDLERGDPDFHEVTIVLLDENGARVGESAWAAIFEVAREGQE